MSRLLNSNFLLQIIIAFLSISLVRSNPIESFTNEEFPEPITGSDFKKETSKGLHVIDFFSPYCSHCKKLEPIWKETWETFREEGDRLNITFSRIDCVESGDLCNEESIEYYPTIRLYGPDGAIKNYPPDGKRTLEGLIKFARKEALDPANLESSHIKSQSEMLTDTDFISLLAGKGSKPYLVSFWPTENMESTDNQGEFVDCAQCTPFQRIWRILSNKLIANKINTGHINCLKSTVLCEELGFNDLVGSEINSRERNPRVALVLPGKISNNLFVFPENKFDIDLSIFEDFAVRTVHNNNIPDISTLELLNIMKKEMDFKETGESHVEDQKIHAVFSYDPETVVPEDMDILEYLIEPFQEIPNLYLYKVDKSLIDLTKIGYEDMYTIINDNNEDESTKEMNPNVFALNTITQFPTFFLFRDGDRISHVFPGYSSTEVRNADTIMRWIRTFSKPLYSEVTPSNFQSLMEFHTDIFSTMVMIVTNSSDSKFVEDSSKILKKLNIAGYKYEHERMEKMFKDLSQEREDKNDYLQFLRDDDAPSSTIFQAMRLIVPHINNLRLMLSFYDISKFDENMSWLNGGIFKEPLNEGDVIVFDKAGGRVFKFDASGNAIDIDSPSNLKNILLSVAIPEEAELETPEYIAMGRISTKLNSTVNNILRNAVYLFIVLVCILSLSRSKLFYRKYKTMKNYKSKRNTVGLLGKKDFQD